MCESCRRGDCDQCRGNCWHEGFHDFADRWEDRDDQADRAADRYENALDRRWGDER